MSQKILLTGATGFVGRQILRLLCESNVQTCCVVRQGKEHLLKNYDTLERVISTPDLFAEDCHFWEDACKDISTIIHCAWYSEPGKYLQSPKNLECLSGTLQFAKGAFKSGVKRFIGIGTCAEYDLTHGLLSIHTPLNPTSLYASSKAACFLVLSQYFASINIDFAWCRLFYLYGEGEDSRKLIAYLRMNLSQGNAAELTSGKQIRDFLDVQEAAQMIVHIAQSKHTGAYNICSGIPITVRQFAEKIADEYGRRDLLKFNARPENFCEPKCVVGICNSPFYTTNKH